MKSFRHNPIHTGLILAMGVPGLALADETNSSPAADKLEVVVVTASRVGTKLRDVTGSVTVFSAQDVENRKPLVVSDVLRSSPGVSVNRAGGLGSLTQVRVRGAEANHVLVLIDGVEANDVGIGGEYNFANLLANDVGQVEVLRGPQSSLWGSGAVAGVISINTLQSDKPFEVNGYLEGGTFDTISTGLNFGGAGEKLSYRVSAAYVDSDGDNISRQGDEKDGYTNKTLNLSAGYDFTDNVSLLGSYRRTEADRDFDDSDANSMPIDADKKTEARYDYASLKTRIASFDQAWLNEVGVNYNKSVNDNITDGQDDGATDGIRTRGYWQSTWRPGGDDNNSLTVVAERIRDEFKQSGIDMGFGDPNRDLSQYNNGYVGEYNHAWQSGLKISLSARHDANEDFKNANTYRAGLLFDQLDNGWQLRTSYGTGVKNPSFVDRFGYYESGTGSPFVGNPDLKPESSRSWEIGGTFKTSNDFMRVDLTYFNERLEDEINGFYYDAALNATTAINMGGTSKRSGAELASWLQLSQNLSLYFAYTYLDAREPEDDEGNNPIEIRRPQQIASANLNYLFLDQRGTFNLNVDYNGSQEDLHFGGPPSYLTQRVELGAYTLVGAMISYRVIDNLEVYARGENLMDEEYEETFGFDGQSRAGYLGFRLNWSL